MVVHYLIAGSAICGAGRRVTDLPPGHRWVSRGNGTPNQITCIQCKIKWLELKEQKEVEKKE
jgi:hypothetical protein